MDRWEAKEEAERAEWAYEKRTEEKDRQIQELIRLLADCRAALRITRDIISDALELKEEQ